MDAKRKSMFIDEAKQKYAELIKELEFIKKSDSEYFDVKGPDKLCMFRPENVQWAKENVFFPADNSSFYPLYNLYDKEPVVNMLYAFKHCADQHVGYILEVITEQEPVVLKSGRSSKNKTEEKKYYIVASYNFYTGNIEVNVLDASIQMIPLMRFKVYDPVEEGERFLNPEAYYEHYKANVKRNEENHRSEQMVITVGMWEDLQKEIKRLENMIRENADDVSENYARRYHSEEE